MGSDAKPMESNGLSVSEEISPDRLDEASAQIEAGMKQCRGLVAELRHKLAANANEPFMAQNDSGAEGESSIVND